MQCQSLKPVLSQCNQTGFVTVDYFITLYTPSYIFDSHGCNKFLHARMFFYTHWYHFYSYARVSSIPMGAMSELETCFEPVCQTGFVTVDDFIALYTRSHVFYSHGCNKFLHAITFFTLADKIAPIFTLITKFGPVIIEPWSQIIRTW